MNKIRDCYRIAPNRVWRTYLGGKTLDANSGIEPPEEMLGGKMEFIKISTGHKYVTVKQSRRRSVCGFLAFMPQITF